MLCVQVEESEEEENLEHYKIYDGGNVSGKTRQCGCLQSFDSPNSSGAEWGSQFFQETVSVPS